MRAIFFLLLSLPLLSCAISPKYPIDINDIGEVGFNKTEVLSLGQLVNVAYTLFDNDESDDNPSFPKPFVQGFKPLMNLQGQDDVYTSTKEFYGHLSWMNNSPGTLVISIRGTSDAEEWLDDAKFFQTPFSKNTDYGDVELGFHEIFQSFTVSKPQSKTFISLSEYLEQLKNVQRIIVVGHSLGSSLATLLAFDVSVNNFAKEVNVLTFASPLTGNKQFVNAFQSRIKNSLRVVNEPDLVPRVPPEILGFQHVWHELEINSHQFPEIKQSILCYHSLLTYLYILSDKKIPLASSCKV